MMNQYHELMYVGVALIGCGTGMFVGFALSGHFNTKRCIEDVFAESALLRRLVHDRAATDEDKLALLAYYDPVTGLPNRMLFGDRLLQKLAQAQRSTRMLGVMFIDLDNFKLINDQLGHDIGDVALKEIADRLVSPLRGVDTVARMGGDEFTVVLGDIGTSDDAGQIAARLLDAISQPFLLDGREISITASIGVSLYPSDGVDAEALVKNADVAMYRAKQRGKNNYQLYSQSLSVEAAKRATIRNNLATAQEREELLLYYQPRVDACSGQILGAEALIRWQHPKFGLLLPGQFINIAEEGELIFPITEWVLRTACTQSRLWCEAGLPMVGISANMSSRLLEEANLVEIVAGILAETGVDPPLLDLEFAESTLMKQPDLALRMLKRLKALGIRISVDDFGLGYSAIRYLKRFPVDAVKIDRSLIGGVTKSSDDAAIARALVAIAHILRLKVTAEGVETLSQLQFLRGLGCDQIQGYFVGRPVAAEEFAHTLQSGYCPKASTARAA